MIDIINRQVIGDGATWMCSEQQGAPKANGGTASNGQMLQILDAVLIDGFNSNASTGAEVLPDGFIKIKFGATVGYKKRQKILVSGANDESLNGEHIITKVIGNDVVIKAPDVSVLTGAIRAKVAPLGWESIFSTSDPLRRAYRSKNPMSTQTVIYLDMTMTAGTGYNASRPSHRAKVTLCADMIEVGVPIEPYTDGLNNYNKNPSGKLFWHQARGRLKSDALSVDSDTRWTVVGNSDYFYFINEWVNTSYQTQSLLGQGSADLYFFGDMPSFAGATDEWNCAWIGAILDDDESATNYGSLYGTSVGNASGKLFIGTTSGSSATPSFSFTSGGGSYTSGSYNFLSYPNPTTNSMVCYDLYAISESALRAKAPRIMGVPHNISSVSSFTAMNNTLVDNYLMVGLSSTVESTVPGQSPTGYFAFDMGD